MYMWHTLLSHNGRIKKPFVPFLTYHFHELTPVLLKFK